MGTGYTRNDSANNIADGNIINASDLDGEFDAVESAFNSSSGHTHDGTSAEGAPIEVIGPTQDVVITASVLRPKTTNTVDLGTSSLEFKDAFFDGTVTTDALAVTAGITSNLVTVSSDDAGSAKGPQLDILRDSSSPADSDAIGHIDFSGKDDGDNKTIYASILASVGDVTDGTEDGTLKFNTMVAGADTTVMEISSGSVSITNATNDAQLTLISTDADASIGPLFVMNRNSSSPADNDQLGKIQFLGEDDADNSVIYSQIVNQIKDASNGTEDGRMSFNIISAGADKSFLNMTHDGTQAEVVVNEESIDLDFRVESNDKTHMLFVDAANNRIGINNSAPDTSFQITETTAPAILRLHRTGATNAADAVLGQLEFFNQDGTSDGPNVTSKIVGSTHTSSGAGGNLRFFTHNGSEGGEGSDPVERLKIDGSGNVGIGTSSPASLLHLESDTPVITLRDTSAYSAGTGPYIQFQGLDSGSTNRVFGQIYGLSNGSNSGELAFYTRNSGSTAEAMRISSAGNVGIGTSSPDRKFHIKTADNIIGLIESTDADAWLTFKDNTSSTDNAVRVGATGDNLRFYAGAAERYAHLIRRKRWDWGFFSIQYIKRYWLFYYRYKWYW